jgi:hypothetical protein
MPNFECKRKQNLDISALGERTPERPAAEPVGRVRLALPFNVLVDGHVRIGALPCGHRARAQRALGDGDVLKSKASNCSKSGLWNLGEVFLSKISSLVFVSKGLNFVVFVVKIEFFEE